MVDVITPTELYISYVCKSIPVIIEGYWDEYIEDPTFRQEWTTMGLSERWDEWAELRREKKRKEQLHAEQGKQTKDVHTEEGRKDQPNGGESGLQHEHGDGGANKQEDEDPSLVTAFFSQDNYFQRLIRFPGDGYRYVYPHMQRMGFRDFVELFEDQERRQKSLDDHNSEAEQKELSEYVALKPLPVYERTDGSDDSFGKYLGRSLPPSPIDGLLDPSELDLINVWIQGRGKVSRLHQDTGNNFLGIISGSKTLFLLDQSKYRENVVYAGKYPKSSWTRDPESEKYRLEAERGSVPHFSPVDDVLRPDLDRFPKFATVVEGKGLIRADLYPGDVLFLPALWWHEVYSDVPTGSYDTSTGTEGANVAINYWFDANPVLRRVLSQLQEKVTDGLDWVEDGRELDAEFERVARINRDRRLRGGEDIRWLKGQALKGRRRDGDE